MIGKAKSHFYRNRAKYLSGSVTAIIIWHIRTLVGCGTLDFGQGISVFGQYVTAFAIFFAAYQFKANHDWNRRHLATVEARNIRQSLAEDIITIDNAFGYVGRKKHQAITVDDIHKAMCELDTEGSLKYTDGKLRLDHKRGGEKVDRAISNFLGAFEYLAAGIRQGVFDDEAIYRLYGGPLIRAAGIFSVYIDHVNKDMHPDRMGKIYENLRHVAKKFETREKIQIEEKEREKTG